MTTPRVSGQDLRAAAEVHRELGPEYSDAVVDSFMQKVDAKIDARLAELAPPRYQPPAKVISWPRRSLMTGMTLGGGSAGILLSFVGYLASKGDPYQGHKVWVLMLIVSVICTVAGLARVWRDRREL